MCLSPNGTLFIGTRREGKVYAVTDTDGDFQADTKYVLASDLSGLFHAGGPRRGHAGGRGHPRGAHRVAMPACPAPPAFRAFPDQPIPNKKERGRRRLLIDLFVFIY